MVSMVPEAKTYTILKKENVANQSITPTGMVIVTLKTSVKSLTKEDGQLAKELGIT